MDMEELTFDEKEDLIKEEALDLTPSQKIALEYFKEWTCNLNNSKQKALRLNGEAGTGKTWLMKQFIKTLVANTITTSTIAFTGKAASRLRQATGRPSCTIHRLIYSFEGMKEYKFFESSLDEKKAFQEKKELKEVLRSKCLIIDEYSMLSRKILQDLISLKKILIFVGDLDQLSPVGEKHITNEEFTDMFGYEVPILTLTDPVRQSEYNPILIIARKIRKGLTTFKEYTTTSQYTHASVRMAKDPKVDPKLFGLPENVIIAYKNKTKDFINKKVRKSLGFKNIIEPNEKLIIMQNDKSNNLFNGEQYSVLDAGVVRTEFGLKYCDVIIDVGDENRVVRQKISIWLDPLQTGDYNYKTTEKEAKFKYEQFQFYKSLTKVAYGYAITCHKAQGSEWQTVYILLNDANYNVKNWLYTAITRAKSTAIIKLP